MILLFLGSWRSTLIVCHLDSAVDPEFADHRNRVLGQTINVMTLGGMALAVGILVDDATVAWRTSTATWAWRKPLRAPFWTAPPDRRPGVRLHVCHLHRVRPGGVTDGRGQIPFHAAGLIGSLRHAGFLLPFAHAGRRPWCTTCCGEGAGARRQGDKSFRRERQEGPGGSALLAGCHLKFREAASSFNAPVERLRLAYRGLLDWALDHRCLTRPPLGCSRPGR